MKKLAVVVTHPIQYLSPVFTLLAGRGVIELKVFYTLEQAKVPKFDVGFNKIIDWNIPLFEGYEYTFVRNTAKKPGDHHFWGIVNPSLPDEIEKWRADAILIIGWNYVSHLKAMRYFKGKIPVYFKGDSHLLNEKPGYRKLIRRQFLKWVYQHTDKAGYVGKNNKDYFKKHGLKEEQLVFMPHAIDNERFQKNKEAVKAEAEMERINMGIEERDTVFLYVGKLSSIKNVGLLIDAFLKLDSPTAHLLIVGDGTQEPVLKSKTHDHPKIHFLPFQDQSKLPLIYRLGNVFVLPSKSETWGLVVNEAMACGLPVVISDKVGCGKDLVIKGVNGYIFRSNDVDDLHLKLMQFNETTKMEEMGKKSLEIISNYSFAEIVSSIEVAVVHS